MRTRNATGTLIAAAQLASDSAAAAADTAESTGKSIAEAFPLVAGFASDFTFAGRAAAKFGALTASTFFRSTVVVSNLIANSLARIQENVIALRERQIGHTYQLSEIEGLVEELVNLSGGDGPKRHNLGLRLQALELKRQEFVTAQAEGFRLLKEREAFNKILAAKAQKNRYQDMIFRLSRTEAMGKYQSAFNHAARYTWLAAKAYDYETNLDPGHPAAPGRLLDQIVKERQLGLWDGGQPQIGQGGLAEILAKLNADFGVLESQLGLNSFQVAKEKISLRHELFRIGDAGTTASDGRWKNALMARTVDDLNLLPEFKRHCRPFAPAAEGPQPGLVIRFGSSIEPGRNFFGRPLAPGDHSYSSANFTTKIATVGVWLEGYNGANLATTPRAYLVPVGTDYMWQSNSIEPVRRAWDIHDTLIPTPYPINQTQITSPGFIPSLDGVEGNFSTPRRHGDFRIYHDDDTDRELVDSEMSTRLIGRSVWNTDWILIIPGAHLDADPKTALTTLAAQITDIKLAFMTYSHNGQ